MERRCLPFLRSCDRSLIFARLGMDGLIDPKRQRLIVNPEVQKSPK
ncbi:MAG: hypothetical protein MUC48_02980 [Leptolyngbya sp. Prado105]|nr:hypothetical protein [Leptolyngbya sp. Prado105]